MNTIINIITPPFEIFFEENPTKPSVENDVVWILKEEKLRSENVWFNCLYVQEYIQTEMRANNYSTDDAQNTY